VSLAPLDERLLRRLIKLLDRVGDRAGAVREYELFARRLDDALELEPSPETRALVEEVRARSQVPPDRVTAATAGRPAGREPEERPGDAATTPPDAEAPFVEPTVASDDLADALLLAGGDRQFGGEETLGGLPPPSTTAT
jgi:hypothetical protein